MKIREAEIVLVEMSRKEMITIMKLIGCTSHAQRCEEFQLSTDESITASNIYSDLSDFFENL